MKNPKNGDPAQGQKPNSFNVFRQRVLAVTKSAVHSARIILEDICSD